MIDDSQLQTLLDINTHNKAYFNQSYYVLISAVPHPGEGEGAAEIMYPAVES